MRVRTPEEVVEAMRPPDMAPALGALVKRPTPAQFRTWSALSPEQRFHEALALMRFAAHFRREADDVRARA